MSSVLFSLRVFNKLFSIFVSFVFDRLFVFRYRFINFVFSKRCGI
nr:MAG TPA: hypothetical protein [Caudoviricetes sp.]